jgi:hypothetical protein
MARMKTKLQRQAVASYWLTGWGSKLQAVHTMSLFITAAELYETEHCGTVGVL